MPPSRNISVGGCDVLPLFTTRGRPPYPSNSHSIACIQGMRKEFPHQNSNCIFAHPITTGTPIPLHLLLLLSGPIIVVKTKLKLKNAPIIGPNNRREDRTDVRVKLRPEGRRKLVELVSADQYTVSKDFSSLSQDLEKRTISNRLHRLGWTQDEIGEVLGVDRRTVAEHISPLSQDLEKGAISYLKSGLSHTEISRRLNIPEILV